ncbi:DUF4450 domain-containing protein [Pelagicoccus albus]|uniref:DUF4450 domain-containing protein n=1 Tax=Pelagicoccus albus TaxID=415222 RepID=A0A7X1B376_9BACT|nr:DUF4450 domain-containing protein [Pelagicoccus albus]MBC2604752.1 DUF4450 domain-containing protein [Pelagicoccus albus]
MKSLLLSTYPNVFNHGKWPDLFSKLRHEIPKPITLLFAAAMSVAPANDAESATPKAKTTLPNLSGQTAYPLRYTPVGSGFQIHNGEETFNRPLYGGNTAFRVDAGDRPEFAFYLPGRGGNVRLGISTENGIGWLQNAPDILSTYEPGSMRYLVDWPELLGADTTLYVEAVPTRDLEALSLKFTLRGSDKPVELIWAYGGADGKKGVRGGDIGTERVPISEWFQLTPERCKNNVFALDANSFSMQAPKATIKGYGPTNSSLRLSDSQLWDDPTSLLKKKGQELDLPVVVGKFSITPNQSEYLLFHYTSNSEKVAGESELQTSDLPEIFRRAETQRQEIQDQVVVDTPDPFLNSAVAALNLGSDAVWDEDQGAVMHGAIAWRRKLLGWRGPYFADALGWHDRARSHLSYWATQQNTDPIPDHISGPDEDSNLARNETSLHSNGALSHSHYDMNLVYIDTLFRHLQWTGDMEFAREVWPVIERHLAWERRLFRRTFEKNGPPLYEGYAAIWASDSLQYHGGGTAHASAYNYWHNLMAAKIGSMLGENVALYEGEAEQIALGMQRYLWMEDEGMYAEFKDVIGEQGVHRSPALWSFYQVVDSDLGSREQHKMMTQFVDSKLPHLPVQGPDVPDDDDYYVLSTSNWMPYTYSTNNVIFGENLHTALAYWQAGRPEEAFRITKGSILLSMFMGICPGNVGSMTLLDVYRRESQRDFADGAGTFSRALIEGLFGIRPNLLDKQITIAPGFPSKWQYAKLEHPDVSLSFSREGSVESYRITSKFEGPLSLSLQPNTVSKITEARVNGNQVSPQMSADETVRLDIELLPQAPIEVTLVVEALDQSSISGEVPKWKPDLETKSFAGLGAAKQIPSDSELEMISLNGYFNAKLEDIFKPNSYRSPRPPYVSLSMPSQGIGGWAGTYKQTANIDASGLRLEAEKNGGILKFANGFEFKTPSSTDSDNVIFTSQWDNYPKELSLPLHGKAKRILLLMAGSTNQMQSRFENGQVIVRYQDGSSETLPLQNPENWWPIDQDYFIDDYQFSRQLPIPPRLDLKTGKLRILDIESFKGQGGKIDGGAATVLDLALDPTKELATLKIVASANEVIIGLLAATLER